MYSDDIRKKLRKLPAVHEVIDLYSSLNDFKGSNHDSLAWAVRTALDKARRNIITADKEENGFWTEPEERFGQLFTTWLQEEVNNLMQGIHTSLRRVVNATGVVLHTNCGRAVLAEEVADFLAEQAGAYSNLELDLETGNRGSRYDHIEEILIKLTGAESALIVNNNAAAVLLIMNTFAKDKKVIVSRGELVEVGGSFRIPEVLKAGGAKLTEVGATNKTWLQDYRLAITEDTAFLLKVHTSNYRIKGFHHEVSIEELVEIGKEFGIPVVEDLGSGSFLDGEDLGLPKEPTIQDIIAAGVHLLTFSGDKLLGGPQAGIIAGKAKMIEELKRNQLTRALRVDKFTLAALEGTLRLYEKGEINKIPVWNMLRMSPPEILNKAEMLQKSIKSLSSLETEVISEVSRVGGGAFPTAEIPTYVCAIKPWNRSVTDLEEYLRKGKVPILTRISKERILIDPRTLLANDFVLITERLSQWDNGSQTSLA